MSNSNQNEQVPNDGNGTKERKLRKPRGPSTGIKSIPGVQRVIEWDELNRPTGPWLKDYKRHIGEISRAKVSILIEKWEDVPQGIQDTLWEDAKREFQIEDSEEKKKTVLHACDLRWKDFKTKLVSGWITCTRYVGKNPRMPYEIWSSFITKEIWEAFVKAHENEKFKERSEKARASQSCNKYPHRMGQKSYAEKIPEWRSKGYLPSQVSSMSGGATSSYAVSSLPSRTYPFLLARSKVDEKGTLYVPNKSTERLKDQIEIWTEKERTGEFVPSRLDDALARALNKKDSRGRVVGVGSHVGIKSVWGPADRKGGHRKSGIGVEELAEFEERVSQRVRKETQDEMASKMDEMMQEKFIQWAQALGMKIPDEMNKGPVGKSDADTNRMIRSSCHSGGHDPFEDLTEPTNCCLAILVNGSKKVVARGFISTNFKPTNPENVKVIVDDYVVEFEEAPVPIPTQVIHKVKHAHGTYVEWPKALVVLNDDEENNSREGSPKKKKTNDIQSGPSTSESAWNPKKNRSALLDLALENASEQCRYMYDMVENLIDGAYLSLVATKFAFKYENDQEVQIGYDDVTQLITGAWLPASILQVFIMDLFDWAENAGVDSIGFMCPQMISETLILSDPNGVCTYMQRAIQMQKEKRFILCPYHERNHWLLLVLSPSKRVVYMFDPIKKQRRNLKIKEVLQNAFRNFKSLEGKSSQRVLSWRQGECAQQCNGRECAYYVMRYMLEIVQNHNDSEDLATDYAKTTPYTDEEIHEIRDRFAEYFVGNIEGL